MAKEARDERIEIRQPVVWSNRGPAHVILRPVLLPKLAELLLTDRNDLLARLRRSFAEKLLVLDAHAATLPEAVSLVDAVDSSEAMVTEAKAKMPLGARPRSSV
jgi:hypothetical protein